MAARTTAQSILVQPAANPNTGFVTVNIFDGTRQLMIEVLPNGLTGNVSNPKVVYVLRWIAGRRAGVPEFNPLYTIE